MGEGNEKKVNQSDLYRNINKKMDTVSRYVQAIKEKQEPPSDKAKSEDSHDAR